MMAAICLTMWIPTFSMFYSSKKGRYNSNHCSREQETAVKHHIETEPVTVFWLQNKVWLPFLLLNTVLMNPVILSKVIPTSLNAEEAFDKAICLSIVHVLDAMEIAMHSWLHRNQRKIKMCNSVKMRSRGKMLKI